MILILEKKVRVKLPTNSRQISKWFPREMPSSGWYGLLAVDFIYHRIDFIFYSLIGSFFLFHLFFFFFPSVLFKIMLLHLKKLQKHQQTYGPYKIESHHPFARTREWTTYNSFVELISFWVWSDTFHTLVCTCTHVCESMRVYEIEKE